MFRLLSFSSRRLSSGPQPTTPVLPDLSWKHFAVVGSGLATLAFIFRDGAKGVLTNTVAQDINANIDGRFSRFEDKLAMQELRLTRTIEGEGKRFEDSIKRFEASIKRLEAESLSTRERLISLSEDVKRLEGIALLASVNSEVSILSHKDRSKKKGCCGAVQ